MSESVLAEVFWATWPVSTVLGVWVGVVAHLALLFSAICSFKLLFARPRPVFSESASVTSRAGFIERDADLEFNLSTVWSNRGSLPCSIELVAVDAVRFIGDFDPVDGPASCIKVNPEKSSPVPLDIEPYRSRRIAAIGKIVIPRQATNNISRCTLKEIVLTVCVKFSHEDVEQRITRHIKLEPTC